MKVSFANTPQATDDQLRIREADGGYTLDVLANDLSGNAKQLWSLHAREPIEPQVISPSNSLTLAGVGMLTIVNGAVVGFEPEAAFAASIDRLAEGERGPSFEFWYVIRLANGAFAKAKATITFEGVNDKATIGGDLTATINEDGVASGIVTVSDVDNGEAKFRPVDEDALQTEWGSFIFDPETGAWTFTPNDAADALNVGDSRVVTLTVTSLDGTATETITVTITGTNDAPVMTATAASASVTEDTVLVATGTLTAADVDNTPNTFQAASGSASYGTWSITTGGAWTYTLNNSLSAVQALNTGQTLADSFVVSSIDGTAQTISITINGLNEPNQPPIVNGETIYLTNSTSGIRLPFALFLANDSDPEGQPLTISAVSNGTGITTTRNAATSEIVLSTASNPPASTSFTYTVQDAGGLTAIGTVTVNILTSGNQADTLSIPVGAIYVASWLDGKGGNDRITGRAGRDWLIGSNGDDTLDGGAGDDVLSGGQGADRFVFSSGYGEDRILDFNPTGGNGHRLDLDVTKEQLTFATSDGNTILTSTAWGPGDQLILVGVTYTAATFDAAWII